MSNPIGHSHPQEDGDKSAKTSDAKKSDVDTQAKEVLGKSYLSLSELISSRPLRQQSSDVQLTNVDIVSNKTSTTEISKIKFDAKRTADISKLLNDNSIQRVIENKPELNRKQDFKWSESRGVNATSNIGLFHPIGSRQHFNLKGIDTKKLQEENDQVKVMVDDFLKNTMITIDSDLSPKQKEELENVTHELAVAQNFEDVIASSIHLARLLRQLLLIEESKKAIMLAMGVDPDNSLANQLFKELERVHPQDIAVSAPKTTVSQLDKASLAKRIVDLSKARICVVGDLLIDELLEGKPERISREAPVLILEHVDTQLIPGGAANTCHNITALGGQCHAIGVSGQDEYKKKLEDMLAAHNISHELVADTTRPTTVKTRILSQSHSLMQQLLRLDRISHENISPEVEQALDRVIAQRARNFHAVILSDYKAGAITDSVIESCKKATAGSKTMLIVDAQNKYGRFSNCSLITPNQPDTEAFLGFKIKDQQSLIKAGDQMLERSGADSILITRGSDGMALFQKGESPLQLPVFNKSEVFDVTGAGDTVVATMTLALVTGASPLEAMALGNLAAGIVVKKLGTAVTSQKEMLDTLETLPI